MLMFPTMTGGLGGGSGLDAETGNPLIPTMTAETTSGVTIITNNIGVTFDQLGGFEPWRAADGNASTPYWLSQISSTIPFPKWIRIDLGAETPVYEYDYGGGPGTVSRNFVDWTLQGSNDASAWTVLDTQTGQTGWTANEVRTYRPSVVGLYRYYRYLVSATGDMLRAQANNIQLYS